MGVSLSASKVQGIRESELNRLASTIKGEQEAFEEQLGETKLAGKASDFIKNILTKHKDPRMKALGYALDIGSDYFFQKKLSEAGDPSKIRRDQTFLTGSGWGEEFEEVRKEAEPNLFAQLLETGIEAVDPLSPNTYGKTDVKKAGEEAVGWDMKSVDKWVADNLFKREGGYVPKFKDGGFFKGFGKKKQEDKAPEEDEALMALEAILSSGYEKKEGEHEFPMGRNVASGEIYPDGSNLVRTIAQFSTPEGERYYPGEGKSRSNSLANTIAMMEAAERAFHSPADSITTDQLAKLKELGLFAGGGRVPNSGTPTILDYFSRQGKTLGGSNKQSLSQMLGR